MCCLQTRLYNNLQHNQPMQINKKKSASRSIGRPLVWIHSDGVVFTGDDFTKPTRD